MSLNMRQQKLILNELILVKNEFIVKWWSFIFIYSCKAEQNNKFDL